MMNLSIWVFWGLHPAVWTDLKMAFPLMCHQLLLRGTTEMS